MVKFIRRNWRFKSRLGKGRKKKQVWRRATGRHNKIREKRKGYPIKVMIGFRTEKKKRNTIQNTKPVIVLNVKGLEKVGKGQSALIGKVGNKKRIEILKVAKERKIAIVNLNVKRKLKMLDKKKTNSSIKTEGEKK